MKGECLLPSAPKNIGVTSFETDDGLTFTRFFYQELVQEFLGHGVGLRFFSRKYDLRFRANLGEESWVGEGIVNDTIGLSQELCTLHRH